MIYFLGRRYRVLEYLPNGYILKDGKGKLVVSFDVLQNFYFRRW